MFVLQTKLENDNLIEGETYLDDTVRTLSDEFTSKRRELMFLIIQAVER